MEDANRATILLVTADGELERRIVDDLRAPMIPTRVTTLDRARRALVTARWCGVVVDLDLPGGDGMGCAERARVVQPDAELLLVAETPEPSVVHWADTVGASFTSKPYDGNAQGVRSFIQRSGWRGGAAEGAGQGPGGAPFARVSEVSRWARHEVVRREARRCGLTPREGEILTQLVDGQPWQEVADGLGISRRTYATHVSHILRKTGADGIGALVIGLLLEAQHEGVWAARHGGP
jgi:DNA-binding NarL/FixJ family response regulator